MQRARKRTYVSPRISRTAEVALERDLLGKSITDSFQILIAGHQTDGFYDFEEAGENLGDVWFD